jgi:cephalosporin-C deacetylase-like acetyl esterase
LPLELTDKVRAAQIEQAYAQCPNTKLVASGYSQGGQIVHNAAALLPKAIANWISSVVIFGDPGERQFRVLKLNAFRI